MSDDAARIERKKPGPPPAARTPVAAEKIIFHCSNGHRISAKAALAGKNGTCATCKVSVRIPDKSEPEKGGVVEVPAAPAPGLPGGTGEEPFVFGPGSGNLGTVGPAAVQQAEVSEDMFAGIAAGGDSHPSMHDFVESLSAVQEATQADREEPVTAAFARNPTAMLVARLWEETKHGGVVELCMSDGSVIRPAWYETRWSGGSHGLFASQAADGSVTLTAVAWDSIQKIVVRQVEGLPDGMFE